VKINKRSARHWILLFQFFANVMCALFLRAWKREFRRGVVVLYGHKLNGNLLALYEALRERHSGEFEVVFLTLDRTYFHELTARGERCVLATSPACVGWLRRADALISDHGLHALMPLLLFSDMKFFDVWHGIPFKGFDADDFRPQHRYDEVWVSSPSVRALYIERFGFPAKIVHATGYARTDRLVNRSADVDAIRRDLGIEPTNTDRLVLFAPTWKQDARNRSLYPFGLDEQAFLSALSQLGERLGATFLLRAHLNSGDVANDAFERIVSVPHARYPDAERVLLASDILVCDWSSIAFDYLVLDRPTIFLDVEPPFAKGFSLDAGNRFGAIAGSMEQLLDLLERYLLDPTAYTREFAGKGAQVRARVYGDCADGHAAERCIARLSAALATGGSSR